MKWIALMLAVFVSACAEDDGNQVPAEPRTFSVQFSGTGCYGDCPRFTLRLDEAGRVDFVGGLCATRPGVFSSQVPNANALAFYQELRATSYFSLADSYEDEGDCPSVSTDGPTYNWSVQVDDRQKQLTHYLGCDGVPKVEAVDALKQRLIDAAGVQAWVANPAPFNCGYGYNGSVRPQLATSYRLSHDGQPLGVIRLEEQGWVLDDCGGRRVGAGDRQIEPWRYLLVDREAKKLSFGDGGLALGSIVLSQRGDAGATAEGLRELDEVPLTIEEATSCAR